MDQSTSYDRINSKGSFNSSSADLAVWRGVDAYVKGDEDNAGSPIPDDSSPSGEDTGPPVFRSPITIVIQLGGGMANHLSELSFGYALKWTLEDNHNISSNIVLRHHPENWVSRGKA